MGKYDIMDNPHLLGLDSETPFAHCKVPKRKEVLMKRLLWISRALAVITLFLQAPPATGINTGDTRLLSQPAINQDHIALH